MKQHIVRLNTKCDKTAEVNLMDQEKAHFMLRQACPRQSEGWIKFGASGRKVEKKNISTASHTAFSDRKVQHFTMHTVFPPKLMRLRGPQSAITASIYIKCIVMPKTGFVVTQNSTVVDRKARSMTSSTGAVLFPQE